MTMGVLEILPKIRLRVMARYSSLTEKLLELPAAHVSQCTRLTE